MAIPSFLRQEGEALYFKGEGKFVFFVPTVYFERKCAVIEGEFVKLIGILNYSVARKEEDLYSNLNMFNFPTKFYTKPGGMEKVKNVKLTPSSPGEDYTLLTYEDNGVDQIVVSTKVPQDIDNVQDFFRLFVKTGNIPKGISYEKVYEYFPESMRLNGGNYKISMQLFGLVASEICRDPDNINNPFRLSKAINEDMTSFRSVSINTIPKYISPYVSITSENWDEAVVGAIMNKNTKSSPLEKVLMK